MSAVSPAVADEVIFKLQSFSQIHLLDGFLQPKQSELIPLEKQVWNIHVTISKNK